MILAPVDAIPWPPCTTPPSEAPPPFASAGSDDWLSGFDFGDLPPTILAGSDIEAFISLDDFGLDVSDLPLSEAPVNFSGSFSTFFKPDAADQEQPAWKSESETPLVTNSTSPTVSSHNSEAGSSVAAGEVSPATETLENYGFTLGNTDIYGSSKSSKKCQNQVGTSDLDGNTQLDPSHKKQLRLLRNRELAFESRQRKKSYISDLEAKCKMLEQERNQLQQQICFSSAENAVLKEELSRLKKRKGSNGVAEPAVLFEDSLPLEFLLLLICLSLLLARLSLFANPFRALVLMAVLPLRATSRVKTGGLSKEQVDSNRCSLPLVDCAREYFDHQRLHFSSRVYGFLIAWLIWHLFSSSMKQRSCNFWRPISPDHLL